MSFKGYKLKLKLYAAHKDVDNPLHKLNFHTFSITLYLQALNENMEFFYEMEHKLSEFLAPFQNAELESRPEFQGKMVTLEEIGDVFFELFHDRIEQMGYELVKLSVYEKPVQEYSASRKMLDADINEIGTVPFYFTDTIEFLKGENPFSEYSEEASTEALKEAAAAISSSETAVESVLSPVQEVKEISEETSPKEVFPEEEKNEEKSFFERVKDKKNRKVVLLFLAVLTMVSIAVPLVMFFSLNYPTGSDTFCHLYRADTILKNIKQGHLYPLYDEMWYNGVEIMRYWAPVPLYILSFFEAISGSIMNGYLVFAGMTVFIGGIGFLLLGLRYKRPVLALILAIVWFFLPENMRVFFLDGNLPRVVINTLMPYLIYLVMRIIEDKKKKDSIFLTLLFSTIGLCHIGFAMMLLVTLLLFLFLYGKRNHCFREVRTVLFCALTGLLLTGLWLMPSLHGSGVGGGSSGGNQVMKSFFESLLVSLNPIPRINGDKFLFYYGLSLVFLSIFGILFGTKKTRPGFLTGIIIYLCTSRSAFYFFEKLPFSQLLWMTRFITISTAFVVVAFLSWNGLKKWVVCVLCVFLIADCIPSYRYIYEKNQSSYDTVNEKLEYRGDDLLLTKAKELTKHRLSVLDLSKYMSFAPFYISGFGEGVPYTFGAGWEGARTAKNIMRLNTAVEAGHYRYVFDRSIELGDDTVLFDINSLHLKENDILNVIAAGEEQGYRFVEQTSVGLLFHRDTPDMFGVITEYPNIAVGKAAGDLAFLFPSFEEGSDTLDDYTADELKKYQTVFLSDFTYTDKVKTEAMLTELANAGVRIVIDMNKVPVNVKTNQQEIYGVTVQDISFQYSYPMIFYMNKEYLTRGFLHEMEDWRAKYLLGLTEVTGSSTINGVSLAFSGTKENENIIFLGYNFAYYAEISNDETAVQLMSEILKVSTDELPERKLVEIKKTVTGKGIEFYSDYDNVNTTCANIDIFYSDSNYTVKNHLVVINKGTTVISFRYPYLFEGLAVTALGLLLFVLLIRSLSRKKEQSKKKGM